MGYLRVILRTLTPLWTGGVDGTMDRIHETGIIGSLRWWYEAIVRGLGGWACEPTANDRCHYDPNKNSNPEVQLCPVCYVFGATGWSRRFRVKGHVWKNERRKSRLNVKVNNNRGWYLGHGFMGEGSFTFRSFLLPENISKEDLWQTLLLTMKLISKWGGLGPKTQQGYGVVNIEAEDYFLDVGKALEAFDKLINSHAKDRVRKDNLPSLDRFFFAKMRLKFSNKPEGWLIRQTSQINPNDELGWYLNEDSSKTPVLPLAPVIRYYLRQMIREARDKTPLLFFSLSARHLLMGEQGRKSLIYVSHAYSVGNNSWEFRIWGCVPDDLEGVSREEVLNRLKEWLGTSGEDGWEEAEGGKGTLWEKLNLTGVKVWWREIEDTKEFIENIANNRKTEQ